MNKKISFPIAIIIIVVCAVLTGLIVWQYYFKGIPNTEIPEIPVGQKNWFKTITPKDKLDLVITDPKGRILSKEKQEIPGSSYWEEDENSDGYLDDIIFIPPEGMINGVWKIKVIPAPGIDPNITFSFEIKVIEDKFGWVPIFSIKDEPVSEDIKEYSFELREERKETKLVYEGDREAKYLGEVNLKAILTDDKGNPISGKEIEFTFTQFGDFVTAITDSNGLASTIFVLKEHQKPTDAEYIDVMFWGDLEYKPAGESVNFYIY